VDVNSQNGCKAKWNGSRHFLQETSFQQVENLRKRKNALGTADIRVRKTPNLCRIGGEGKGLHSRKKTKGVVMGNGMGGKCSLPLRGEGTRMEIKKCGVCH